MMIRFFAVVALLLIFSCSSKDKEPTAVSAYKEAYEILQDKDYTAAAKKFEKVSDEFAFSSIASKSQMMAVYAYYKAQEYEEVQRVASDFATIFPSDENMDYVLYLKALSYYDVMTQVDRAQEPTREASMIFREIVARFPNSKYVDDVRKKIEVVDRNIAGSLMSKGRYFMNNEKYIAAINNFQQVIQRYSRTNQLCEAHYRLAEISFTVGIDDWVIKYVKDLKRDCPNSLWLEKGHGLIEKL